MMRQKTEEEVGYRTLCWYKYLGPAVPHRDVTVLFDGDRGRPVIEAVCLHPYCLCRPEHMKGCSLCSSSFLEVSRG